MHVQHASEENRGLCWRTDAGPCLALLLLASLFFLAFFNRFLGLRSGDGEFSGGIALLAGRLPYRDYYTAGPPLNQIKSALELTLFGKTLLVSRLCGAAERLGIALLLYVWLRRNFRAFAALLGSLATIIVSAGDGSDPLASYNHDAILFAMLCGLAATLSLEAIPRRRLLGWAFLAGTGASFSALTKQTVGLGTAATILLLATTAMLRIRRPGPRAVRLAGWLTAYLTGFCTPLLLVSLYLHHLGVLGTAMRMLFRSGPAAKAGHPVDFLWRDLYIGTDNLVWVALAILALLLTGPALARALRSEPSETTPPSPRLGYLGVLIAGIALFTLAEVLSRAGIPAVWNFSKIAVYYTLFGITLFGVVLLHRAWRARDDGRLWGLVLFAGVGWTVAVTLSLSWPAFEAMTLPGLALLIAAATEGVRKGRWLPYALLVVLITFQVREKLDLPFTFGFENEPPVRLATAAPREPMLRGLRLPPSTLALVDAVTSTAAADTQPGDTIFTYPEMGILYTLTRREPPTRADSHNIDVVPDWFAQQDAQRLLDHPPAVLVYAEPSDSDLQAQERLWRRGRRSGQRALVAALDQLTAHYLLRGTFALRAGDTPIRLYVRPDKVARPAASAAALRHEQGTAPR